MAHGYQEWLPAAVRATCILIYSEWEKEMDSCGSPRRVGASFLEVPPSAFRPHWPDLGHIPIPGPITVSEEPGFSQLEHLLLYARAESGKEEGNGLW